MKRGDPRFTCTSLRAGMGRRAQDAQRTGVKAWQLFEVVLVELLETEACRKNDPEIGFPKLFV